MVAGEPTHSHLQRMLAGELYQALDPELRRHYERAQRIVRRVNATAVEDQAGRRSHLLELFGAFGEDSNLLPPLRCDYGFNVQLGAHVFVNYGTVFTDTRPVVIGDQVLVGPGVQFLAADHPLDSELRRAGWESGRPISVGAGAWLGGGAIVLGGVSIGENAVIGAGSVVTRDVPAGAVAAGNPARIQRRL